MKQLLLLLAFVASAAQAQNVDTSAACAKYVAIPIPRQDIGKAPKTCDASAAYYGADGTGQGGDADAARHCAFRQRTAGDNDDFTGAAILMMIYANGRGVPRNIPLAKRFACEIGGEATEVPDRLKHLNAMAHSADGKPVFDVCDDVSSHRMFGNCALRDAGFMKVRQQHLMEALTQSWSAPQKDAWLGLRKAADAFFDASSHGEIDQSGLGGDQFVVEARETLEDSLINGIEGFEQGSLPQQAAADGIKAADARLNAAYQAFLRQRTAAAKQGTVQDGTVLAKGVRDAQRKWLAYREAWVAFGAARYPAVPADAWRSWLSDQRTQWLKHLASGKPL